MSTLRDLKSWLIAGVLLGTMGYAVAEDLILTTYYPSPRGVYDELRANHLVMGSTTNPGNAQISGSLAVGPTFAPGQPGQTFIEGSLGVGTTNPAGQFVVANQDGTVPGAIIMGAANQNADVLSIQNSAATPLVLVDAGGRVGIGIPRAGYPYPTELLHLFRDDADVSIRFEDPDNALYTMGIDRSDGQKFKLNYGTTVGASAHLTLDHFGQMGIGTANPQATLDVAGNSIVQGNLQVNGTLTASATTRRNCAWRSVGNGSQAGTFTVACPGNQVLAGVVQQTTKYSGGVRMIYCCDPM